MPLEFALKKIGGYLLGLNRLKSKTYKIPRTLGCMGAGISANVVT